MLYYCVDWDLSTNDSFMWYVLLSFSNNLGCKKWGVGFWTCHLNDWCSTLIYACPLIVVTLRVWLQTKRRHREDPSRLINKKNLNICIYETEKRYMRILQAIKLAYVFFISNNMLHTFDISYYYSSDIV